jgi:hypothetical protein
VEIKADLVDPTMNARDAARRVEDLAAAQVVISGDLTVDRTAVADQAVVLEKLHGADWAGQAVEATRDGAIAGAKAVPSVPSGAAEQAQAPTPAEGVGAWQKGAEAPRLAGMAQTARAGHSSLPGRSGSQLRRNTGMPGRTPTRGPELER